MFRIPTVAELALDLSDEIETFKSHLESLTRCSYAVAVGGSRARITSTVCGDNQAAKRFAVWVNNCLSDPRLVFRSHFRQALILAAAHSAEFEKQDSLDRPADECFYVLLAKHELVSSAARRALAAGCLSLSAWWERSDDAVAMLELMALLLYPSHDLTNQVRCFAARCRQLDGDDAKLLSCLQNYSSGKMSDADLRAVQREYSLLLDRFYKFDFDQDPSCGGVMEANFRPLINLCDPTISWHELCFVSQRICRQVLTRRHASRAQLANTMRRWMANPWVGC